MTAKTIGEYDSPAGVKEVYEDLHASDGATHDIEPRVSEHAKIRFIERIDGSTLYPRARIEEAFERSIEVCVEEQAARYNPEEDAAFIYDRKDGTVITCIKPGPGQMRRTCDCGGCLAT